MNYTVHNEYNITLTNRWRPDYFRIIGNSFDNKQHPTPDNTLTINAPSAPAPMRIKHDDEPFHSYVVKSMNFGTIKPFEPFVIKTFLNISLPANCTGRWVEAGFLLDNDLSLTSSEFVIDDFLFIVLPFFNHHPYEVKLEYQDDVARLVLDCQTDCNIIPNKPPLISQGML
jgi:hypothetical protein